MKNFLIALLMATVTPLASHAGGIRKTFTHELSTYVVMHSNTRYVTRVLVKETTRFTNGYLLGITHLYVDCKRDNILYIPVNKQTGFENHRSAALWKYNGEWYTDDHSHGRTYAAGDSIQLAYGLACAPN